MMDNEIPVRTGYSICNTISYVNLNKACCFNRPFNPGDLKSLGKTCCFRLEAAWDFD